MKACVPFPRLREAAIVGMNGRLEELVLRNARRV